MRLDEIPIHVIAEERVNMFVTTFWCGAIEGEIFPIANSRHKANAKQMCQAKNHRILRLGTS